MLYIAHGGEGMKPILPKAWQKTAPTKTPGLKCRITLLHTLRSKSLLERALEATVRSESLLACAFEATVRSKTLLKLAQ